MGIFGRSKCQFLGVGPVLPVPDVEAAVTFYCERLGFTLDFMMGDPPDHGSVTRDRVGIQFTLAGTQSAGRSYPGWFYCFVEDVDRLAAEFVARQIVFSRPVTTFDYGMREFELVDLNGFRLRFGQYV